MDYLVRLKSQIRKGSAQDSAMQSKAGADEVPMGSRTGVQQGKEPATAEKHDLLPISIADIKPQEVREFLRLQPDLNFSSCWQLTAEDKIQGPEHLGLILSGYWSAAGRASESKGIMKSRLEATLVAILASKKRESASAYGSLHLQFEKSLSLPWSYKNRVYVLGGTTDYSLWYGGQKKAYSFVHRVEGTLAVIKHYHPSRYCTMQERELVAMTLQYTGSLQTPTSGAFCASTMSLDTLAVS